MKRDYPLSFLSSVLVVGVYLTFTLLAYASYPLPYAPARNWLSDLGSPALSPGGALFYNTGIVLTAVLVLIFFIGLTHLRIKGHKAQNVMTTLTLIFGAVGALGMLLSAVYPINHPAEHSLWCRVLFFGLGTGFAFSVAALRYHPTYPRPQLAFGVLVVVVNLGTQVLFNAVPVVEWINVALILAYCLTTGIQTRRYEQVAALAAG
jgi:hypothetical membrane protein